MNIKVSNMNSRSEDFILRLFEADWFANCSMALEPTEESVPVKTWASALEICATQESDDARLEGSNELTVHLFKYDSAALNQWNNKIAEIKPRIINIIQKKLSEAVMRGYMPSEPGNAFRNALEWDILILCMAREYSDIFRTKYHEMVEGFYLAGRFPCGWVGEVPDEMEDAFRVGKLAVL